MRPLLFDRAHDSGGLRILHTFGAERGIGSRGDLEHANRSKVLGPLIVTIGFRLIPRSILWSVGFVRSVTVKNS